MAPLACMLCMLVTEYPETDKVEIIPEYSGVIDRNQAITLNSRKPTGVDAMIFRDKSVGGGEGVVLLIYKNGHDTGATLNPAHLIKYVLIVVKPGHGNVATFGKIAKGDFFRRISGLGFLLSREYSSRPLVRIPQYYQGMLEENAPALVVAGLDAGGRDNMCLREEQAATYRAALEVDLGS